MPRGIRALHDFAPMHLMHAGERLVAYIPVADWLECACWCERSTVPVDQAFIGVLTFSCGRDSCVAPDGSTTYSIRFDTQDHVFGATGAQPELLENRRYLRAKVRVEVRRVIEERIEARERSERLGRFGVAMRRNDVNDAWREGKTPFDIALRVHADLTTVVEDLKYLRAKGRLGGRALEMAS